MPKYEKYEVLVVVTTARTYSVEVRAKNEEAAAVKAKMLLESATADQLKQYDCTDESSEIEVEEVLEA